MLTIVENIQSRLQALVVKFCATMPSPRMPSPRAELVYTYLVARFVMHCHTLMTNPKRTDEPILFLQQLKDSTWKNQYPFNVQKTLRQESSYIICACHLKLSTSMYGVDLVDSRGDDGYTTMSAKTFSWLVSFRLVELSRLQVG